MKTGKSSRGSLGWSSAARALLQAGGRASELQSLTLAGRQEVRPHGRTCREAMRCEEGGKLCDAKSATARTVLNTVELIRAAQIVLRMTGHAVTVAMILSPSCRS